MTSTLDMVLPIPALTDHAFATPHGQLMRALRPFARQGLVSLLGDAPGTTHPLVAHLAGTTQVGVDPTGRPHPLPFGTSILLNNVDPATGRASVLACPPAQPPMRVLVTADVLQSAYREQGATLLEDVLARLARRDHDEQYHKLRRI